MHEVDLELLSLTRAERDSTTIAAQFRRPPLGDQAALTQSIQETEEALASLCENGLVIETPNSGWLITPSGLELLREAGLVRRSREAEGRFSELWDHLYRYYDFDAAVEELYALPRSDSFWQGTNRRATPFKVVEWFRTRLEREPANNRVRWFLIGNSVGNDFGFIDLLRPLIQEAPSNLRWLIEGCRYTQDYTGSSAGDVLRPVLADLTHDQVFATYLESSPRETADRQAISAAKSLLAGSDLWEV